MKSRLLSAASVGALVVATAGAAPPVFDAPPGLPDPGPGFGSGLSEVGHAETRLHGFDDWTRGLTPPAAAGSVPRTERKRSPAVEIETDLLDRLRADFSLPIRDDRRVDAELAWYARHPGYFDRVFARARPYLHHIVAELERRDMPREIALLPIVESAFDPFAYSHGRAAGLWQIIPGTGRRFGLKQNWWYDGRRDVIESTRAALDYLEFLANRYDGDYELAVAAYNSGEGTVDRALRKNRAAGKPTDFWSLRLPRETRAYVPRLLALAKLIAEPWNHGLVLPRIPDEPQIGIVKTDGQLDLALAAELAGLSVDELYRLNPGFNQWATDPKGPHKLVVPVGNAPQLEAALAALPASERMRWTRHKVKPGQTLSHIADRYSVTTRTIRDANGLSGNLIRAGQHLMIPTAARPLAARRPARRAHRAPRR